MDVFREIHEFQEVFLSKTNTTLTGNQWASWCSLYHRWILMDRCVRSL